MKRHHAYETDDEAYDEPYIVIERRGSGVGSFLTGLAIGAGVALLFAPRAGVETRRDLRRRARRVTHVARDAAEDLSDSVVDRYEHAKRSVEDKIESARQSLEIRRRQAAEALRAGREAAQQARQELEARIAETKAAYRAGTDVARAARRPAASARPAPPERDAQTAPDGESETE